MKKLKLYIETSVWNFLFADDAPEKKAITEMMFAEVEHGRYEVFVSEIVENEIREAPFEKRQQLLQIIKRYQPEVLEDSVEARRLVRSYIENGLLSDKQLADLAHIATATVNGIDVLVSWNMKHLVKLETRMKANAINRLYGYHEIEICTPEEAI